MNLEEELYGIFPDLIYKKINYYLTCIRFDNFMKQLAEENIKRMEFDLVTYHWH